MQLFSAKTRNGELMVGLPAFSGENNKDIITGLWIDGVGLVDIKPRTVRPYVNDGKSWELCDLQHNKKHDIRLSIHKESTIRFTYCILCGEARKFVRKETLELITLRVLGVAAWEAYKEEIL